MRQRIQRALVRALDALPPALQVALSARPPVRIDGQTLAPEQQLMLRLLALRREPPIASVSPQQARAGRRRLAAALGGPPEPVRAVEDLELDLPEALAARHYAPAREAGAAGGDPLLVYLHGGGFVFGDLDTHDGLCRLLCRHARTHVLAIDYRLAPEHPFPAAAEDACAAFAWAAAHAEELGADPERVGVAGDSAGGNLAAVVAQQARQQGSREPALQVLIYPVVDFSAHRRSRELFGEGFLLTNADMDWFECSYLGGLDSAQVHDPRASPLLAEQLAGLAPALVVTAGFDPLRDEGEAYATALRAAGNVVLERRFPGYVHAFVSSAGVSRGAREAVIEIAGMTRGLFAGARVPLARS